jgi:hypothetical protein
MMRRDFARGLENLKEIVEHAESSVEETHV